MNGTRPSKAFMTHCRREVLQAQWDIILDDEFLIAYEHGIVIQCCDEIVRRFYPRIVTYSADYKEKYAWIVCPRCNSHKLNAFSLLSESSLPPFVIWECALAPAASCLLTLYKTWEWYET
jgi:hypothetical protein